MHSGRSLPAAQSVMLAQQLLPQLLASAEPGHSVAPAQVEEQSVSMLDSHIFSTLISRASK